MRIRIPFSDRGQSVAVLYSSRQMPILLTNRLFQEHIYIGFLQGMIILHPLRGFLGKGLYIPLLPPFVRLLYLELIIFVESWAVWGSAAGGWRRGGEGGINRLPHNGIVSLSSKSAAPMICREIRNERASGSKK